MTLFKQMTLIMSIFLLFVLISVMTYNFQSTKEYVQDELSTNAQNTASFLSLSLAGAKGDLTTMSTMINAVFDSGSFEKIALLDTKGNIIYQRVQQKSSIETPQWFKSLYDFKTDVASATVSSGWNPIGTVKIYPLKDNAHLKLYKNFLELLQSFVLFSIFAFSILYFLIKMLLSSLKKVKEQAEEVSNNNFIINKEIPTTTEFKEVTLAMNKMVAKVKNIFEKEAESVKNYHNLLYTDTLTGLHNRNFFQLKITEYLTCEEAESKGVILTLFLNGVVEANRTLGHEEVDQFIQIISNKIKEVVKEFDCNIGRIDGTKISIIFPALTQHDIDTTANELLLQLLVLLEKFIKHGCECGVKLILMDYDTKDSASSILDKIEQYIAKADINSLTHIASERKFEPLIKQDVIQNRIEEHNITLALQDVFDIDKNILHTETYIRLFDEENNLHEAREFIPLIHRMQLDTKLDKNVINHAIKEPKLQNKNIAINVSLRFIQDEESLVWLKERLASVPKDKIYSFEISNHNILKEINKTLEFSNLLRKSGHNFGIDRFSIENNSNLNYLQMLKPSYIKIDSSYLCDMFKGSKGEHNSALQILIESLDIKLIATNIEDIQTQETLKDAGIKYFQGSLFTKPKLV